jgi:hypothetical protein
MKLLISTFILFCWVGLYADISLITVTLIDKTKENSVPSGFKVSLNHASKRDSFSVTPGKDRWRKGPGPVPIIVRKGNLPGGTNRFSISVTDRSLLFADLHIDGSHNITITIDDHYFDINHLPLDVSDACESHAQTRFILPRSVQDTKE